jgi:hypothetical protein
MDTSLFSTVMVSWSHHSFALKMQGIISAWFGKVTSIGRTANMIACTFLVFAAVVSHYIDLFVEVIEYLDNTLEND